MARPGISRLVAGAPVSPISSLGSLRTFVLPEFFSSGPGFVFPVQLISMPPHPSEPVAAKPATPMPDGLGIDHNAGGKRPAVLHIEDDSLWRRTTAALLDDWPEFCQMESAANGRDGIRQCAEKMPAIVILDLGLPDLDGFEVLDRLNALPRPPQILLLTCRRDQALLYRLGSGGIAGLIWKDDDFVRDLLRPALVSLAAGKSYFAPDVSAAMRRFRTSPDAFFKILSPWELKLVTLLAQGFRDDAVALKTGCGSGTIRNHWHNIAVKLGLPDRHAVRLWAEARGFGRKPSQSPFGDFGNRQVKL